MASHLKQNKKKKRDCDCYFDVVNFDNFLHEYINTFILGDMLLTDLDSTCLSSPRP